ncbi:hypothetical protein VCR12J2_1060058 [Vibrio coralliirubri]|nr:hypothetical protein VCR12J2_1060058 [Vibrio coralliirubri]
MVITLMPHHDVFERFGKNGNGSICKLNNKAYFLAISRLTWATALLPDTKYKIDGKNTDYCANQYQRPNLLCVNLAEITTLLLYWASYGG